MKTGERVFTWSFDWLINRIFWPVVPVPKVCSRTHGYFPTEGIATAQSTGISTAHQSGLPQRFVARDLPDRRTSVIEFRGSKSFYELLKSAEATTSSPLFTIRYCGDIGVQRHDRKSFVRNKDFETTHY
ncbi:MAG TPA: hypothetical protein PLJ60_18300 [Chryseolinea sp.]|nr:hypothetical protein [Flavobacteriales bacterium]HPM32291.1 hypothetical protein [Chryseolinea sp.]